MSRSSFIQHAIEANLRPEGVGPALDPENNSELPNSPYQRAKLVHETYSNRLMDLRGVEGIGIGMDKLSKKAFIRLYLSNADITDKLPPKLESIRTNFEITGKIVAAAI